MKKRINTYSSVYSSKKIKKMYTISPNWFILRVYVCSPLLASRLWLLMNFKFDSQIDRLDFNIFKNQKNIFLAIETLPV